MLFLSMLFGTALVLSVTLPVAGAHLVKESQGVNFRAEGFISISSKERHAWSLLGWLTVGVGLLCGAFTYTILLQPATFDAGPAVVMLVLVHILITLRACCDKWQS